MKKIIVWLMVSMILAGSILVTGLYVFSDVPDYVLDSLKDQQIVVMQTENNEHYGVLLGYDAETLALEDSIGEIVIIQRSSIESIRRNTSGITGSYPGMVHIPGGTFTMGDEWGDGYDDERPTHAVTVSSFWMDETEVTTAAFEAYIRLYNPNEDWYYVYVNDDEDWKHFCNIGSSRGNHPVNCVSWYAAHDYCHKHNKRLPTESEWEYAAGNGVEHTKWSLGNSFEETAYCFNRWDERLGTCPVKSYARNSLGLYDMTGNVYEWCEDGYDSDYYNQRTQWINPVNNTENSSRVLRGGSWNYNDDRYLRVANRNGNYPDFRNNNKGFRCVAP